jgi:hypothetical protein
VNRQGREFKDLDYPNEEDMIEKLKDAKRNFILCLRKNIILKKLFLWILKTLIRIILYNSKIVGVLYPGYRGPPFTTQQI